ncbi:glycosyltransferase [Patescibacteria group bacterium]|nr:glycosyltransferase [Patescibacteria group bacterium]
MKNLKVSIIIPTYNNGNDIERCLLEVFSQTYSNIEVIISDGGSSDDTVNIAKKYTNKILHNKKKLAEPGVSLGMKNASGDLFMIMAADNFFRDRAGIEKMVRIFDNKDIDVAFPIHVSNKDYSLITKYRNTFTDSFNHFVYGYASNGRTFHKIYKTVVRTETYDVYDFLSNPVKPIIAFAQGFTVRGNVVRDRKHEYDDILPIIELINSGKKIVYAHGIELIHDRGDNLKNLIRKQRWATRNGLNAENYGINVRRKYLTSRQRFKMFIYPLYAFSLVLPTIRGVVGWILDGEIIWLFHPIISFVDAYAITVEILFKLINSSKKGLERKIITGKVK